MSLGFVVEKQWGGGWGGCWSSPVIYQIPGSHVLVTERGTQGWDFVSVLVSVRVTGSKVMEKVSVGQLKDTRVDK